MATREWNAASYDALPLPHKEWGRGVIERLPLTGDELVLDAGCGTGRDAAALLAKWPDVRLIGVDGSQRMLDQAAARGENRARWVLADLTEPLPIEPVDAVMSVAAFHWIPDHDVLFANLRAAMRDGAPLVSDCGGFGNIASVNAAIGQVRGEEVVTDPAEFQDADDTRERLTEAGFEVRDVRLRPDPFRCEDPDVLERYLATVILGSYLDKLPEDEQEEFVHQVRLALPAPEIDYVRLEIEAVAS